jgi:hypothetical protein
MDIDEIDDCNICGIMILSNQKFIRMEDHNMEIITIHNSCQSMINSKNQENSKIISRLDASITSLGEKIHLWGEDNLQFPCIEVLKELKMIQNSTNHKNNNTNPNNIVDV